jgi:hypothetical protein
MLTRIAIAVFACTSIIVVFLHNPMSGWRYETLSNPYAVQSRPCTDGEREELRQTFMTANKAVPAGNGWTDAQIERNVAGCTAPIRSFLPFELWASKEPHQPWFGSVLNVLSLLVMVALLCAIVVYLFARKAPRAR